MQFHVSKPLFPHPSSGNKNASSWTLCCVAMSLVAQSCPTLWDPRTVARQAPLSMGILQAKILEWVATPFSRGSSQPRNQI